MPNRNNGLIASLHNTDGLEAVRVGNAEGMTLRIRNATSDTLSLGEGARITVDFSGAGGVAFGDARAGGFSAAREGERLVLTSTRGRRSWYPDELLEIELPSFQAGGEPGVAVIAVTVENAGEAADGVYRFALVKLGAAGGTANAQWTGDAAIPIAAEARSQLPLRMEGASRLIIALSSGNAGDYGLLANPSEAADVDFDAPEGWSVRRFDTVLPVWELTAEGGATAADVNFQRVRSLRHPGIGHVFVYALGANGHSFIALPVQLVTSSVRIDSFSADTQLFRNITAPATVKLSWQTTNARTVTLSGAGVVYNSQSQVPMIIEQTTTFVLTAYDAALDQVVSQSLTVTVDPPLSSRLVPIGTIALWSGLEADIPDGWEPCNGTAPTPDLRDRFILGAGGSEVVKASGNAQTHTHTVPATTVSARTSWVGDHTHRFPSKWYARKLAGGDYTGIDTNGDFNPNDPPTQGAGGHDHSVSAAFGAQTTGVNEGSIRPPWYALFYIMKVR